MLTGLQTAIDVPAQERLTVLVPSLPDLLEFQSLPVPLQTQHGLNMQVQNQILPKVIVVRNNDQNCTSSYNSFTPLININDWMKQSSTKVRKITEGYFQFHWLHNHLRVDGNHTYAGQVISLFSVDANTKSFDLSSNTKTFIRIKSSKSIMTLETAEAQLILVDALKLKFLWNIILFLSILPEVTIVLYVNILKLTMARR